MYESDLRKYQELETFNNNNSIHKLPDIFHYWSNKYVRPLMEEHGLYHPDDIFVNNLYECASSCQADYPKFVSIGSGNCDTEIRIVKKLKKKGLEHFMIDCIDLNPNMLKRGSESAIEEGVSQNISFIEQDFNQWIADKEYNAVIANQSLHHIENLEGVFSEIKKSLHEHGLFITSDMIGRNGHQRWPEALVAVHNFWKELPDSHKYNHQLGRFEEIYENWDCSTVGFEGIRAQDVLPLLIDNFSFQFFIAFSNVVNIFVGRSFGPNFDPKRKWDREFIDKVQRYDEDSICMGNIKPTQMKAVMRKVQVEDSIYSRNLSPEFCVRKTDNISYSQ